MYIFDSEKPTVKIISHKLVRDFPALASPESQSSCFTDILRNYELKNSMEQSHSNASICSPCQETTGSSGTEARIIVYPGIQG
jgi:hypothetical protein